MAVAAQGRCQPAGQGERRGEAPRTAEGRRQAGREGRDARRKPAARARPAKDARSRSAIDFDGLEHRHRRRCPSRPASTPTSRPARPASSSTAMTAADVDLRRRRRAVHPSYDLDDAARTRPLGPASTASRCRPTARRSCSPRAAPESSSPDGRQARAGRRASSNVDAVEVRVDPRAEWPQIFDEAWRINRDYFYDPGMHGADWKAMKAKYAAFLPAPRLAAPTSTALIQWMCSELGRRPPPGRRRRPPRPGRDRVPGGLLGADYAVANGRYRFKKVYGGLNWNARAARAAHRARRRGEGRRVPAGRRTASDLAPAGRTSTPRFEDTAGQDRRDHGRPEPRRHGLADGQGRARRRRGGAAQPRLGRGQPRARSTRPPAAAWPTSTSRTPPTLGHTYFKRYFFPQADKEAIIVDERFNGGGSVADYYIDMPAQAGLGLLGHALRRRPEDAERLDPGAQGHDHRRDGRLGRRPPALDVPQVQASGTLVGTADLGRPGRHPRLPGPDGRRQRHRARTWPSGREEGFGRRERGRPARHRGRADAGRRHRRPGPAARGGHQGGHGRAQGQPPAKPKRPPYPDQGQEVSEGGHVPIRYVSPVA
ncbi:MAG: hypothetical protein M0C28_40370 [Candidatus Moduliflexus flocculans]|nr:hypothetical protein [Candidatus Moduliflexus flocculans]